MGSTIRGSPRDAGGDLSGHGDARERIGRRVPGLEAQQRAGQPLPSLRAGGSADPLWAQNPFPGPNPTPDPGHAPLSTLHVCYSIYVSYKLPLKHIELSSIISLSLFRVYPWLRGLGYTSLTVFLMGFFLWNVDNIFCEKLRALREKMPPVLGAVTQFHAWWHILTGLGSYLHILLSLYTRTLFLKHRPKVKFLLGIWPVLLVEPPKKL
ncbi:alkaline ceramidase 3-like [Meleagris gallopavo]|uniref:alkaline ceramidase 3-like n=1 Tax=Meleagris gallopavo TaxID=9103 RepID=UPI0005499E12|nr:alkaline ceramidase 3-like [Meleagris gallopavo]